MLIWKINARSSSVQSCILYDYYYLEKPKAIEMTFEFPALVMKFNNVTKYRKRDDEVRLALNTSQLAESDIAKVHEIEARMRQFFPFHRNECYFTSILGRNDTDPLYFTIPLSKKAFFKSDAESRYFFPHEIPTLSKCYVQILFTGIKIPKTKFPLPFEAKFAFDIGQLMLCSVESYLPDGFSPFDNPEGEGSAPPRCIFAPVTTAAAAATP